MAVSVDMELVRVSQEEFGAIAYRVMREVFAVHGELGRLFDEKVYQRALAARVEDLKSEVRIDVMHRDFCKSYFMDAVVARSAVFELKAVESLSSRHRSQLLNYLLLTELQHGKLVNFGTERIEHEFVNATLTLADRRHFAVDDSGWCATEGFGTSEKSLACELLQDWGTGLARALYEEALVHFLGGHEQVLREIDVCMRDFPVAKQTVALCAPRTAIRLTTFENDDKAFAQHLISFLNSTKLDAIQWINIARNQLTFRTLHSSA